MLAEFLNIDLDQLHYFPVGGAVVLALELLLFMPVMGSGRALVIDESSVDNIIACRVRKRSSSKGELHLVDLRFLYSPNSTPY